MKMMKIGLCFATITVCLLVRGTGASSVAVLLEQGIYTEETVGDLPRAIEIYSEIAGNDLASRKYVAEAVFRKGRCLALTEQNATAIDELKKLTKRFPEQEELIQRAKKLLAQLQPSVEINAQKKMDSIYIRFAEYKRDQMTAMASELGIDVPEVYAQFFQQILDGAGWGEVAERFKDLKERHSDSPLYAGPVLELWGAYIEFHTWNPALLERYAEQLLGSMPEGSIYLGGSDPGRFVATVFASVGKSDGIIVLTQNQLGNANYLEYIRLIY